MKGAERKGLPTSQAVYAVGTFVVVQSAAAIDTSTQDDSSSICTAGHALHSQSTALL